MDKFVLEALKRYVLLNLIESTSMGNSSDFMKTINANALETAQTVKEISMFGLKPNPQFVQQQPPVNNPPNPFQNPCPQNPFGQNPPIPELNNAQIIEFMTNMQNQFIDLQNNVFKGLQELYNSLQSTINALKDRI